MKKLLYRKTTIDFKPTFPYKIYVYFTNDVGRLVDKLGYEESRPFCALNIYNGDGTTNMVLPWSASINVIVHEASHAAWNVVRWNSLCVFDNDNEVYAFIIGRIAQHIVDFKKKIKVLK